MPSFKLTMKAELFPGWWSGHLFEIPECALQTEDTDYSHTSHESYQSITCRHGAQFSHLPLL